MDSDIKQKALEDAIELTKVALSSPTGNACVVAHPEAVTKFLDDAYSKLCNLWQDAVSDD